ncbi:hypothetical protein [Desulforhopalus sp. IMCC35007]|uniref:hypothetical protein n=1 Tax=Desulforhopalus sp. IMCC35007 TaxID=2569543 RepID=UPI0010AEDF62|nr:hypothetical protein [Desulforhopalus sp. IMCC35007]TKB10274.1 hypothetical protein FCL48_06925 [Desulforhopalus sp. IMCC35007]
MQHSLAIFFLIIPSVLCLLSLTKYILVKKENKLLAQEIKTTTSQLELHRQKLTELEWRHNEIMNFHNSMQQAELTTKFQAPRLQAAHSQTSSHKTNSTPEKYKYIHSLIENGMGPDEIASVLSISLHEARQLVCLSTITPAA